MQSLNVLTHDIKLKVRALIELKQEQQKTIAQLKEECKSLKAEKKALLKHLDKREEQIKDLKTTNALLGSDDFKTKTKHKINTLIKDIDYCINHLAS